MSVVEDSLQGLPALRWLNLRQSIDQFSHTMTSQVSEGVIVETFERGAALLEFLRKSSSLKTQIAVVGVNAILKMILTDNFVHTDLHLGNLLARLAGTNSPPSSFRCTRSRNIDMQIK